MNYDNAIKIPAGDYKVEINLNSRGRTLVITKIDPTAVTDIETAKAQDNTWYNIQGMKINGTPSTPGIYINAGKKVVIK